MIRTVRLIRLIRFFKQFINKRQDEEFKMTERSFKKVYPIGPVLGQPNNNIIKKLDFTQRLSRLSRASHQRSSIISIFPVDTSMQKNPGKVNSEFINGPLFGSSFKALERLSAITDVPPIPATKERKSLTISKPSEPVILNTNPKGIGMESRVGRKLSDLMTKRAVVLVLVSSIFLPLFTSDFYLDVPNSQIYQMNLLSSIIDSNASDIAKKIAIDVFIETARYEDFPLIFFSINKTLVFSLNETDPATYRETEALFFKVPTKTRGELFSIVSSRKYDRLDSLLNVAQIGFVFVLLIFSAIVFNKDAKDLLLIPLERMIVKVNKMAQDPLLAKDEKLVAESGKEFENEAVLIENAIMKLGGLLALGLGEAGTSIIKQNIANLEELNPTFPGKQKAAIFGFCSIRHFTEITEILQEEVMVFVNAIADIVHSMVDKYGGTVNKNMGDAFLVVWKFPEDMVHDMPDGQVEMDSNQTTQNIADCALISLLKAYARINRDPTLLNYRNNPSLNASIPNFKVQMGFGLHVGWAIEGPIGSQYKVDPSYLSPNVNMASRVEAATKKYGVPILFSGELYELLSDEIQDRSRLVDVATLKGSTKPIELYTVDVDIEEMKIAKDRKKLPKDQKAGRNKQKRESIQNVIANGQAFTLLETDNELKHMFRSWNQEFQSFFSTGFDAYIDGDWAIAKKNFDACLEIKKNDGPTLNLKSFLAEHFYVAPDEWNGYRILTEK